MRLKPQWIQDGSSTHDVTAGIAFDHFAGGGQLAGIFSVHLDPDRPRFLCGRSGLC
jgi:hypothetical protein